MENGVGYLHECSYLKEAEINLIKPISPNLSDEDCHFIAELLIGMTTRDPDLILSGLKELIDVHSSNKKLLLGLISILLSDSSNEEEIKIFSNKIDIKGEFMLLIMELSSPTTRMLPSILMKLMETNSLKSEVSLCKSLISIFKNDLSSAKILTKKLDVDHHTAMAVLASATGHLQILSEYYSLLQEKLGLSNIKTVKFMAHLSHGDSSCIQSLAGLKSDTFSITDPEVAKAIFEITRLGYCITTKKSIASITDIDPAISTVTKKLSQIFKI